MKKALLFLILAAISFLMTGFDFNLETTTISYTTTWVTITKYIPTESEIKEWQ